MSEYLVGQGLVRLDKERLDESAIIIKSLLILKLPVMSRTFPIFASVSFRYFKAE